MLKSQLECELNKARASRRTLEEALVDIRRVARDCIQKAEGKSVSSVWLIERITQAITKAAS